MASIDPVAQTFFVDAKSYPKGFFVHSIDLCFKLKDAYTYAPLTLQIRPTINGYPHSNMIIPLAEVTVTPEKVNTTDTPDFVTAANFTRFTFPMPIYLNIGEYAMVLQTNSDQYEIYYAEIGKTRLDGSERLISKQPYSGSFFKSQNGSTYTAVQDADLMFRLNRCFFTVGTTSIILNNVKPTENTYADLINVSSKDLIFTGTAIEYSYKKTVNSTSVIDSTFTSFITNENLELDQRAVVATTGNTCVVKVDTTTYDNSLSPVIDLERLNIITVENIINDGGLKNSDFTISVPGTGYAVNTNTSVTITGSGSGANAFAIAANGFITSIYVDVPGSDYLGAITATIAAPPVSSGNTTATVTVANELAARGGNAIARYITRSVVLNDGFDAATLRVYLSAVNLSTSEVSVYYKVLADEDPDIFDDRPYVKMQCVQAGNEALSNTTKSQHKLDFKEYLYIPTTTDCSYVGLENAVTYTTFRTFAIKIVMTTSDTTSPPRIADFRAIALAP